MGENIEDTLKSVYYDLSSKASYAGINKILAEARERNSEITMGDVMDFLKSQPTYTLHKPLRKKFPRLQTIASGLHTDWQCDLAVFDSIRKFNNNFRYMLLCIDVLSRMIFVAPVKTKSNADMIVAFQSIFDKSNYVPWRLISDQGTEFNGKEVRKFYKKFEIDKISLTGAPFHAGMCERAIRTVKDRLYRYFTQNGTWRWVDVIDKIVDNINHSKHSVTKVTPASVSFKNAQKLLRKLYKPKILKKKARYISGDFVRLSKLKGVFSKSYLPNYTDEIFTVHKVHKTNPVTYTIEDSEGEIIVGKFYEYEIVGTSNNLQHIEKIIRKRTRNGEKEVLVKWTGMKETSWIKESSLE